MQDIDNCLRIPTVPRWYKPWAVGSNFVPRFQKSFAIVKRCGHHVFDRFVVELSMIFTIFSKNYSNPCLPHFKCCFATGLYQFQRQEVSLIIFDDYGAEEGAWRPQGVRWLMIWRWFHSTFKLRRSNLHVIFSLFWYFLELGNSSKSPWTAVLIIIRHIDSVVVVQKGRTIHTVSQYSY